jgi:outer membrane receptor protein involved in Fe transport
MKSRIAEYDPDEDPETYSNVSQPLSPEFMGSASILYLINRFVEFGISGSYMSESYLEPTNQENLIMPSFFVTDVRIGIKFMEKNSLNLFVNNIFDKQYFTYGAPSDPDFDGISEPGYFVQPPRNIFATLIVKF